MAEFKTEYYTPMDRGYHEQIELEPARPTAAIEEPIIPIGQIGMTVPEHDPSGRFKNILQNVQAAIRGGTGNLQIVFQTPVESAIGGRPKAYGEEVRRAIKEVAMANEVMVTGMEMPTSMTNLSGWDQQRGIVDEEKRQRDLDEVKEMIKFAADVGQGGGVDIVSWEYDRPVHRANWWDKDSSEAKAFKKLAEMDRQKEEIRFVDRRSGQIGTIPIRDGIPMFVKKDTFEKIEATDPDAKPDVWYYEDFERWAQKEKTPITTLVKDHFLGEQLEMAKAQTAYYLRQYDDSLHAVEDIKKNIEDAHERGAPESAIKILEDRKRQIEQMKDYFKSGVGEQKRVQEQMKQRIESWTPMDEYVLGKSEESYAEAGITAMQMQDKLGPKNMKKDLYVGPETGWPQFFGSHPKEFAQLILESRKVMENKLVEQGYARSTAHDEARRHIKGTLDTSHVGMWLQNFHPELPWDDRIKKFKKWYMDEMEELAKINKKEQIIGAIQAVDSAGAAHGHLPAGQGILPVKDAVELLKLKGGFNGYVTAEGHEEEKFGEGRMGLKTWQHFNAPLASGYGAGGGVPVRRWGDVQQNYFGKTYSPQFMFGAYAPSNEFKLWSEVPLE
jgi:sugar phosphate isomerase/epimerase